MQTMEISQEQNGHFFSNYSVELKLYVAKYVYA